MRRPLTSATAFDLVLAYARQHRISTRAAEEMAQGEEGLDVPAGTLVYVGARWYLDETVTTSRRFEVQLPRTGSRTVEVTSRARLAINLIELGYPSVQAGRHAFKGWTLGQAHAGDRLVLTELTGAAQ